MTLRYPKERHEMLQTARLRQQTEAFKRLYGVRAGIEGTFSSFDAQYWDAPGTVSWPPENASPAYSLELQQRISCVWCNGGVVSPSPKPGLRVLQHLLLSR
jgi:hypothetical protein